MELIFYISKEFLNPHDIIFLNISLYKENICSHKINLKKYLFNCIHIQLNTLIWTAAYSNFYLTNEIIADTILKRNSIYSIINNQVQNILDNDLIIDNNDDSPTNLSEEILYWNRFKNLPPILKRVRLTATNLYFTKDEPLSILDQNIFKKIHYFSDFHLYTRPEFRKYSCIGYYMLDFIDYSKEELLNYCSINNIIISNTNNKTEIIGQIVKKNIGLIDKSIIEIDRPRNY